MIAQEYNRVSMANRWRMKCSVKTDKPVKFALQLRLPWWLTEKAIIKVNGVAENVTVLNGYFSITREWNNDELYIEFPTKVSTMPLPDSKPVGVGKEVFPARGL